MNAGRLRHRIVIERPVQGEAARNGQRPTLWEPVCACWADFRDLSGRELLQQAAFADAQIEAQFVLRWRPGISSAMRVRFRGEFYDIAVPLNPDSRRRELRLMVRKCHG